MTARRTARERHRKSRQDLCGDVSVAPSARRAHERAGRAKVQFNCRRWRILQRVIANSRRRRVLSTAAALALLLAAQIPSRAQPSAPSPYVGITLVERSEQKPRPVRMHIAQIDTEARGIRFMVSAPGGSREVPRQQTLGFLRGSRCAARDQRAFLPAVSVARQRSVDHRPRRVGGACVLGLRVTRAELRAGGQRAGDQLRSPSAGEARAPRPVESRRNSRPRARAALEHRRRIVADRDQRCGDDACLPRRGAPTRHTDLRRTVELLERQVVERRCDGSNGDRAFERTGES